jgi:hypothetical protein
MDISGRKPCMTTFSRFTDDRCEKLPNVDTISMYNEDGDAALGDYMGHELL